MKFYTQKIAAVGLIAVFASLAGWFCVNPQGMQMTGDMDIHYMEKMGDVLHSVLNACAVNDCLSKLPQVVVAKKFNIDSGISFLANVAVIMRPPARNASLASASSRSDAGGPVSDTLSSVFKKE